MPESYENLMAVTAPELTDCMRMVTDSGGSRRALLSALAALIVEEYAGTTLAGQARTLQSAVNAINSAISNEVTNRGNAVSNEASARQAADEALGNRITAVETSIFIGDDGKCYVNL